MLKRLSDTIHIWSVKLRLKHPKVRPGDQLRVHGIGRDGKDKTGTLGCFVRARGKTFALTCAHILARPGEQPLIGTRVRVKSSDVAAAKRGSRELGSVARASAIRYRSPISTCDVALVSVDNVKVARLGIEPHKVGAVSAEPMDPISAFKDRRRVVFFGAESSLANGENTSDVKEGTSKLMVGTVVGLYDTKVDETEDHPFCIEGVLKIEVLDDSSGFLCQRGDSGAMIWSEDRDQHGARQPLGLLVSETFMHSGFVLPIQAALSELDATLIGSTPSSDA
jgi:hypothetical protein